MIPSTKARSLVIGTTVILFIAGLGLLFFTGVSSIGHLIDDIIAVYLLAWALYGMLSSVSRSEVGKRFILTTSTLTLCWLLAESAVLVGAVDYRALFGSFESDNALSVAGRQFDQELLWRHDPYYQYESNYQGNLGHALCIPPDPTHKITVRYDRNGFRNSHDLERADIVMIGDSYVEGYMTDESMLATTILGQLQGTPVANLGHSGYGPQQELSVLKRFGLPLKPKTVIWAFFEGNDFMDTEGYDRKLKSRGGIWQDFWFRSLTRNLSSLMIRNSSHCVPNAQLQQFRAEFIDASRIARPVFFAPSEVQSYSTATFRKAIAPIAEAARLCRERNIRFIVAFIPEKYRVYRDLNNVEFTTEAIRSWQVSDLPVQLRQLLTALAPNVEYVDLTPQLRSASRKGVLTYLSDDTHWTEAGNRVVAEALHRAVLHPGSPLDRQL